MNKKILLTIATLLLCGNIFSQTTTTAQADPKANKDAEVICGNARFTVLTSKLIRMEWAEDGIFEDNATLAIVNRNLPVPAYKVTRSGKVLTIKTNDLTLKYITTGGNQPATRAAAPATGKFTPNNLSVTFKMTDTKAPKGVKTVTWHYGDEPTGNLKGTTRTLDKLGDDIRKKPLKDPFEDGILSRDGWAIVDESERPVLIKNDSDWGEWIEERNSTDRQDLYIFAYGHNYTEALADFTKVAGEIPMPPKYMFGYWWSRYWQYSDYETVNLAKEIRSYGIPMDVMVIDMDWHTTNGQIHKKDVDEFGQRPRWTGYTWQKDLFPDPDACLNELHELGLKTSLNLHPASGIRPVEEEIYDRFTPDYLSRTTEYDGPEGYIYGEGGYTYVGNDKPVGTQGAKAAVPFRICQQEWADAYFNSVIRPIENQGVDFWWLDWQQWRQSKYKPTISNTFWLNYTFFNDKVRRVAAGAIPSEVERPVIYHRWGGLGSHRYQIGFSGDTYDEWNVLKFLPYFTATASNVGYGYWGHDIGGHMQRKPHNTNPELYTRWLQYGVFTPIFKTHCTKDKNIECRIWKHADHFEYMREAILLRYRLSPYIYAAARQAWESGVSICRPVYYYYPEEDNAYTYDEEFFFGDNILATVIGTPASDTTALAERKMWFPGTSKDTWYDMATGKVYQGGTEATLHYTISENPWFIKGGAIIPMAENGIMNLQENSENLHLLIAPGDGYSEVYHYEDDGASQAYATEFARTKITKTSSAEACHIVISPREGAYKNMPAERKVRITLEGVYPPKSVKINGMEVPYKYDGNTLAAEIKIPEQNASEETIVECTFDASLDRSLLSGAKGLIRRVVEITPDIKFAVSGKIDFFLPSPAFCKIGSAGYEISRNPSKAEEILKSLNVPQVIEDYTLMKGFPQEYTLRLKALLDL